MIRVTCACGKSAEVRDELAGKKVKCPVCHAQVVVPGEAPLLLDDPPPAPPPPPPAVAPAPEPPPAAEVEPPAVRILPWKTLAVTGFAAAAVLFVVAAFALAMRPGAPPPAPAPKPLISAVELEILRRDLAERELEAKTLREIAMKGDDPARFQAFLKQLDDLRKERDKMADASARAEERARVLGDRLAVLEKNAAAPPPPPPPPGRGQPSRRPVPPPFNDEPTRQVDDDLLAALRSQQQATRAPLTLPSPTPAPRVAPAAPSFNDEPTRLASVDPQARTYDDNGIENNFDEATSIASLEGIAAMERARHQGPSNEERTRAVNIRNDPSISDIDWDLD